MATFMSSTSTTGEKRKKVITYGKSSRLSIPPPRLNALEEDAPSPERPRKHTSTLNGQTAESGGLLSTANAPGHARAATTVPDLFEVPSEDEFEVHSTKPAKRPLAQRIKTELGQRANFTKKDAVALNRPVATTARSLQRPGVAKPPETTTGILQTQPKPQKPTPTQIIPAKDQPLNLASQIKVPRPTEQPKRATTSGQRLQRSNTSSRNVSRATTPGMPAQPATKVQSVSRTNSTIPTRKTTGPAVKQPDNLDVFDVPLSDEEVSLPIPEAPRQIPRQALKSTAKELATSKTSSLNTHQKVPAKTRELDILQNRKRKGSVSSITTSKPAVERVQESAPAQRDRKYPKKAKRTSPGQEPTKPLIPRSAPHVTTIAATTNKPMRTKTRTVPVLSQPAMSKGQSSPTMLHKMVPVNQLPERASDTTANDVLASDDTMYEIPDSSTTPVRRTPLRRTTTSTPGSVTPRQKDLFSTLLGSSAAPKTSASALASLQLTDKKPRSLLGALARSKSDLTYSSQARKTRLIDTLRDEETSSEDDESGSDEEADDTIVAEYGGEKSTQRSQAETTVTERTLDEFDMDVTTAADSQTSQVTSGAGTRQRLTYAAQRSYLEEANAEDEFLISMDLDDNWKLDSQTVSTDDEDGPMSQVRTHHELKKFGQNTMFSWDMEESIREISDKSNNSIRRNAFMELCTKMADAGFVSQLLDSGFTHKLLENVSSTGDIIFDFIAVAAVLFILQTKPTFSIVEQVYRSGIITTTLKTLDNDADILRTARDRKSNMSKIAQESLADFRTLVLRSKAWSSNTPEKVSPQLLGLQTLETLILSLRASGNTETLLKAAAISKLTNVCMIPTNRFKAGKASPQDFLILDLSVSVLEAVSTANQDYSMWPNTVLQQLSEVVPVFFEINGPSRNVEAMKLCMNLTNNKPKACRTFSTKAFVQPLVRSIVACFDLLHTGGLHAEGREKLLATLTLSLGAMINLAELNDEARLNTDADGISIEVLVEKFLVGSERAAKADSVEESKISVVVGFLTVLLGNLCLNDVVRSKVCASLPEQRLHLLLDNMKEFACFHEHVDKKTAARFEGPEGQETLNNYYMRIMHVVKELEGAKA